MKQRMGSIGKAIRSGLSVAREMGDDFSAHVALNTLMKLLLRRGSVWVTDWHGRRRLYKAATDFLYSPFEVIIKHPSVVWEVLGEPSKGFANAYVDGRVEVAEEDLPQLLELVALNQPKTKLRLPARRYKNKRSTQKAFIEAHYNKEREYQERFLGKEHIYSCARFDPSDRVFSDEEALSRAQMRKIEDTLERLALQPGERLLDIGCGGGFLLVYAAKTYGVTGTGITLSEEQYKVALALAEEWGVDDQVTFHVMNYQDLDGNYDAVVSIGMFEHVGRGNYDIFFAKVKELLVERGRLFLHTIGQDPLRGELGGALNNAWVDESIFQGGHLPTLAELSYYSTQHGFAFQSGQGWDAHYAQTLKLWWKAHQKHRAWIIETFGEEFYRQQVLWLVASMVGFGPHGRLHLYRFLMFKGKATDPFYVPIEGGEV